VASLLIRNVDDALRAQLKVRAACNQRSLEEEVRETLRTAIARDASQPRPRETLADIFVRAFGPERGVDLALPPRSAERTRPPIDFSADDDR